MAYFFGFGNNKSEMESEADDMPDKKKKEEMKAYEKYTDNFTPKPKYVKNMIKAFVVGGSICVAAMHVQNLLISNGVSEKQAGNYVTVILIMSAQLLTGIGVFDTIGKFAGAGVIVPITGFANSMVAPAIEYKKEGPVLGVGSKLFTIAGPVLVCGISVSVVIGILYWCIERIG